MDLSFLDVNGISRTLVYLLDHKEGVLKSQIRKDLEISTTTIINIYETLWESELIKILPNPKRQYFILTKKGEKIALLLKKVQDLIADSMKMSKEELIFLKDMIENDLENKLK